MRWSGRNSAAGVHGTSAVALFGLLPWLALAGCVEMTGAPVDEPTALAIADHSASCDREEDEWRLELESEGDPSEAWFALLSGDGEFEVHELTSEQLERYGAWEQFGLNLAIASNPEEAVEGASTALLCDDSERSGLAIRAWIHGDTTDKEAACTTSGVDTDWSEFGFPSCDE